MDLLAHTAGGHWIVEVGIYLGPFIAVVGVILFTDRQRRKREQRASAEGAPAEGS